MQIKCDYEKELFFQNTKLNAHTVRGCLRAAPAGMTAPRQFRLSGPQAKELPVAQELCTEVRQEFDSQEENTRNCRITELRN